LIIVLAIAGCRCDRPAPGEEPAEKGPREAETIAGQVKSNARPRNVFEEIVLGAAVFHLEHSRWPVSEEELRREFAASGEELRFLVDAESLKFSHPKSGELVLSIKAKGLVASIAVDPPSRDEVGGVQLNVEAEVRTVPSDEPVPRGSPLFPLRDLL
jgi:hypothetical protein